MGTVGLSFGSPTSGTGFDVSSTVSSIVSNLRQVETPWKNQLTALQSEDTVLSNLGTLFSSLSSDVSQLTDFEGVLAQKSGSSSDTNVLELTSASSAAIAGTHSVAVTNLAQTSSGYIDAVANGADTMAGSLQISVNNGTAHTFNMSDLQSADQNLAGLAAAINSSGIGVSASVLTDSSGSRLSLMSNASGKGGQMSAVSSLTDASATTTTNPTGALNYNSTVDGKDASLSIDGVPLSSASNTISNLIPGVTFQLLAPSSSSSPVQVTIANDNSSVESAASSMVTDYNSLIQALNTQQGNDSSGKAEPLFGSPTVSLLQQELLGSINGANAAGYLGPIADADDTLSGSITLQVATGTAKTIIVDSSDNTMAGLAAAINSSSLGVTASVVTNSSGTQLVFASQLSGAQGALTVSAALTDTSNSNAKLAYNKNSDINSLSSLGITMNNDGTLTLDASTLDSVLNSDFSGVVSFFQNANSWGMNFSNLLNNAGNSSSSGILKMAQTSNSTIEGNLNAEVAREETLITAQQKTLTTELNSVNEILQEIPSQLQSVSEIYAAISGYNGNQNG